MTIETVKEICYILTYELGVKVDYVKYSNDRVRFTIDGFNSRSYATINDRNGVHILGYNWNDVLKRLLISFRRDMVSTRRVMIK